MTPEQFQNNVQRFQNGDGEAALAHELKIYFDQHPEFQKEYQDVWESICLIAEFKSLEVPDPGESYWNSLAGDVRTAIASEKTKWQRFWLGIGAFAATATALLALITWPTFAPHDSTPPHSLQTASVEIQTFVSQLVEVQKEPIAVTPLGETVLDENDDWGDYPYYSQLTFERMERIFHDLESMQI